VPSYSFKEEQISKSQEDDILVTFVDSDLRKFTSSDEDISFTDDIKLIDSPVPQSNYSTFPVHPKKSKPNATTTSTTTTTATTDVTSQNTGYNSVAAHENHPDTIKEGH
jgi:hypothetical protein